MAAPSKPRNRNDFEVAIICALQLEADAVEALFDKFWDGEAYGKAAGDRNTYNLGVMGSHNVVLAYMPRMGKASAATVATSLRSSFQQVNLALVVGICGGVPNAREEEKEILLGDVIISTGLVQYDLGRRFDHAFVRKSTPGADQMRPKDEIQGFLNKLCGQRLRRRLREKTSNNLTLLYQERQIENAKYLGAYEDRLFEATYRHKHHNWPTCHICTNCTKKEDQVCEKALESSCADLECDPNKQMARSRLRSDIEMAEISGEEATGENTNTNTNGPLIHFGLIASGDTVMKSGEERDMIAGTESVIAFEMEGVGIWNNLPCLVIKSVCDYADAHKNKKWQGYSAFAAASCARAVLEEWTTSDKLVSSPTQSQPTAVSTDSSYNEKTVEDSLRLLSFSSIDDRLSNIALPHQDTCEWLFKTQEFQQWRNLEDLPSHNGVLWLKGKPGAGKSTLMKHALPYCQEIFKDSIIAAYFFNARGGDLERTPLGMLRSLLYQLLDKDHLLCNRFMPMFLDKQKKHGKKWEWNIGELKNFLLYELKKGHFKPWVLLIDALDECNEAQVHEVVSFLESLSKVAVRTNASLRILLSSRHYPTIDMKNRLEVVVEKQKEHDEDIITYVQDRLRTTNESIKGELLRKAEHVFMWVVLVVEMLNQQCHGRPKAMQKKLQELPSGLDEVFTILLEKDNPNKPATILALQWVLFTRRKFKPEELYFAVPAGTEPDDLVPWDRSEDSDEVIKEFITSISRGLIEITHVYPSTVQFIHESVNDFLLRNKRLQTLDPKLSEHPVGVSHNQLVGCCLAYIWMGELDSYVNHLSDSKKLNLMFPFLDYATCYIFDHSERAQVDHVSQQAFMQRLQRELRFLERIKMFNNVFALKYEAHGGELAYSLSLHGCYELLKLILLNNDPTVNVQGGFYGNALQAASFDRNKAIVELLLERGADINAQGGYHGTALQAALFDGNKAIVELLLERGADINAHGGYHGTALQAALAYGNKAMMELLIERGVDVNVQGGYHGTTL